MQNSDIEKCILVAASGEEFILETFLHGCFSGAAEKLSCFDAILKRNEFLWFFLSKGFREEYKHTELASHFVQKQYFS